MPRVVGLGGGHRRGERVRVAARLAAAAPRAGRRPAWLLT